jgi:pimeloyl-ACP methyl ester carboxylesterase
MTRDHPRSQDNAFDGRITAGGVSLSFDRFGSGLPLVLVHGSFSDHRTNWQSIAEALARHYTVHALARRGRGGTDATQGHSVEDEAADLAALIRTIDAPVLLLGHSHGAHVALAATRADPSRVEKLVLYEPPVPGLIPDATMARLEECARAGDWDGFTTIFFGEVLSLPAEILAEARETPLWADAVADGPATLQDLRAMQRYGFDARDFSALRLPVILQIGTESPRSHFVTDALLAALPDARLQELRGHGHDAMLMAPDLYARELLRALAG